MLEREREEREREREMALFNIENPMVFTFGILGKNVLKLRRYSLNILLLEFSPNTLYNSRLAQKHVYTHSEPRC